MLSTVHRLRHTWVTFWKQEPFGQPGNAFHIHVHTYIRIHSCTYQNFTAPAWSPFSEPFAVTIARLKKSIEHAFCGLLTQPLDAIAEYFGEDVAFYFAWLAFYTKWLVAPALLGIICFAFQLHAGRLDHWICLPYSIFVMVRNVMDIFYFHLFSCTFMCISSSPNILCVCMFVWT